ncbi:MAG: hypothetical protein IPM55_22025 [Acidobacteria bacterium]|nr:hypothetical protein [Acidobacteriota bacterium]
MQQHLSIAKGVAAGLRHFSATSRPMAAAQAAWRFYKNERVSLVELAKPILEQAKVAATACREWALVIHDWSPLHYTNHKARKIE